MIPKLSTAAPTIDSGVAEQVAHPRHAALRVLHPTVVSSLEHYRSAGGLLGLELAATTNPDEIVATVLDSAADSGRPGSSCRAPHRHGRRRRGRRPLPGRRVVWAVHAVQTRRHRPRHPSRSPRPVEGHARRPRGDRTTHRHRRLRRPLLPGRPTADGAHQHLQRVPTSVNPSARCVGVKARHCAALGNGVESWRLTAARASTEVSTLIVDDVARCLGRRRPRETGCG
jgi:hypothetical protein